MTIGCPFTVRERPLFSLEPGTAVEFRPNHPTGRIIPLDLLRRLGPMLARIGRRGSGSTGRAGDQGGSASRSVWESDAKDPLRGAGGRRGGRGDSHITLAVVQASC